MKVLLVDDEPDVLEQAKIFLERADDSLEVEIVISPEKGLDLIEEKDYDVIVSDYQMPEMDGLEFLEIIREERRNDIPFIMFTGKGREEVAIDALNLGADRYLQKGGDPKSQYSVLAKAIVQEVNHYRAKLERDRAREEWRETFDRMPGIATVISPSHEFLKINKEGVKRLGMSIEDLIGKKCYKIVHNQEEPIEECPCPAVLREGEPKVGEVFEEGGRQFIPAASPLFDENGEIRALVHTIEDITEQKKTEEELRKNKRQLEAIFNDPEIFMGVLDTNGNLLEANKSALEFVNANHSEVKGKKFWNTPWWTPSNELQERLKEAISRAAEGDYVSFEATHEGKDGEVITVDFSLRPVKNEQGIVTSLMAGGKDITERKKREEELERSREEYKELIDGMNDTAWVIDFDGNFVEVNRTAVETLGYSREELLSMSPFDIDVSLEPEVIKDLIGGMEEDQTQVFETVHETKSGDRIPVEVSSSLVTYQGESAILSVARDITQRKEAEKRLEESIKRERSLFENIGDAVFVTVLGGEDNGKIIDVNETAVHKTGFSKEELIGTDIHDLIVEHGGEIDNETVREKLLAGETVKSEIRFRKKEGDTYWAENIVNPIDFERARYGLVVSRDITDRKETEERFQAFLDEAPEAILVLDLQGDIVMVNDLACNNTGYSREELLSKNIIEIDPAIEEDDHRERYWDEVSSGKSVSFETTLVRKDGSRYPAKVNLTQIEVEGRSLLIAFHQDISRQKETEEREEFLHSLLRHDVRNKAQIVQGYLELMEDYDLPKEVKEFLEKARESTRDGIEIMEKVRRLREVREEEIKEIDLYPVLEDVVKENEDKAQEKGMEIEFECELDSKVRGGDLLKELFTNIITNSIQHSGGNKIRVSGEERENEVVCSIEDDGKGIPDDIKERIFERGFKRGENAGSGLGMYLVKEIAKSYGGNVDVNDSELGGARFDVRLKKV